MPCIWACIPLPGDSLGTAQNFPSKQELSSSDSRTSIPPTRQGNQQIQSMELTWELYRASHPGSRQEAKIPGFLFHQLDQEPSRSRRTGAQLVRRVQVKHALTSFLHSSALGSPGKGTSLLNLVGAEQPRVQVFSSTYWTGNQQNQSLGIVWELHRPSHLGKSRSTQIPEVLFHQRDPETNRSSASESLGNSTELSLPEGGRRASHIPELLLQK